MPSIRRSLLVYLLSLLALALGAVGVFVDRFANAAVRQREASEKDRIEQALKVREREAKEKFDADLLAETKAKAREVQRTTGLILGQNWGGLKLTDQSFEALRTKNLPEPVLSKLKTMKDKEFRQLEFENEVTKLLSADEKDNFFKLISIQAQNVEQLRPRPPGGPGGTGPVGPPPPQPQPPVRATEEEARVFLVQPELLQLTQVLSAWPTTVAIETLQPREFGPSSARRTGFPGWVEYDGLRVVARIGEALHKAFEDDHKAIDDEHTGCYQFTLVGTYPNRSNRTVTVISSTTLESELPLAPVWLEPKQLAPWDPNQDLEPKFQDIEVPGKGKYRQVVTGTVGSGRPILFPITLPPPPLGQTASNRSAPFRWDVFLHVFVHHARPYSELEARLADAQKDRAEQLARVGEETHVELTQLRARLILIGVATFAALVLGGWVIVARGLSPLHKLSDAVSQVSERDFRLPVIADQLGHELAPIHARITQTLTLLQRAFAREKQAVADISHELRTPIAALLATIDVSLRKPRTPDQYRTTLEECRLISKQLGQLVERIMTLALLDAGNDQTHPSRTDAIELAGGCAAVIRPLAAANNLSVDTHFPEDLVLDTDSGKLREVLMNLLHNAVEYNRPGGTIDLTVRRDGARAVFEVRDTGIGMSAEVRDKIFERFFRADASRHATGVHAGLGLAIVKEYVARLGGEIVVESAVDVGTTFRVTLPLAPTPADPVTSLPPAPAERAKPRDPVAASS